MHKYVMLEDWNNDMFCTQWLYVDMSRR